MSDKTIACKILGLTFKIEEALRALEAQDQVAAWMKIRDAQKELTAWIKQGPKQSADRLKEA